MSESETRKRDEQIQLYITYLKEEDANIPDDLKDAVSNSRDIIKHIQLLDTQIQPQPRLDTDLLYKIFAELIIDESEDIGTIDDIHKKMLTLKTTNTRLTTLSSKLNNSNLDALISSLNETEYHAFITYLNNITFDKYKLEVEKYETAYSNIIKEKDELKARIKDLTNQYKKQCIDTGICVNTGADLTVATTKISNLDKEVAELKVQKTVLEDEKQKLTTNVEDLAEQIRDLGYAEIQSNEKVSELEAERTNFLSQISLLTKINGELDSKIAASQREKEAADRDADKLRQQIETLKAQTLAADNDASALRQKIEDLDEAFKVLKEQTDATNQLFNPNALRNLIKIGLKPQSTENEEFFKNNVDIVSKLTELSDIVKMLRDTQSINANDTISDEIILGEITEFIKEDATSNGYLQKIEAFITEINQKIQTRTMAATAQELEEQPASLGTTTGEYIFKKAISPNSETLTKVPTMPVQEGKNALNEERLIAEAQPGELSVKAVADTTKREQRVTPTDGTSSLNLESGVKSLDKNTTTTNTQDETTRKNTETDANAVAETVIEARKQDDLIAVTNITTKDTETPTAVETPTISAPENPVAVETPTISAPENPIELNTQDQLSKEKIGEFIKNNILPISDKVRLLSGNGNKFKSIPYDIYENYISTYYTNITSPIFDLISKYKNPRDKTIVTITMLENMLSQFTLLEKNMKLLYDALEIIKEKNILENVSNIESFKSEHKNNIIKLEQMKRFVLTPASEDRNTSVSISGTSEYDITLSKLIKFVKSCDEILSKIDNINKLTDLSISLDIAIEYMQVLSGCQSFQELSTESTTLTELVNSYATNKIFKAYGIENAIENKVLTGGGPNELPFTQIIKILYNFLKFFNTDLLLKILTIISHNPTLYTGATKSATGATKSATDDPNSTLISSLNRTISFVDKLDKFFSYLFIDMSEFPILTEDISNIQKSESISITGIMKEHTKILNMHNTTPDGHKYIFIYFIIYYINKYIHNKTLDITPQNYYEFTTLLRRLLHIISQFIPIYKKLQKNKIPINNMYNDIITATSKIVVYNLIRNNQANKNRRYTVKLDDTGKYMYLGYKNYDRVDVSDIRKPKEYYYFGPFKNSFESGADGFDIPKIVTSINSEITQNKNICVIGYGQSGSGKTTALIGTVSKPGIFIHFLGDTTFTTTYNNKLEIIIIGILNYTDPAKNTIKNTFTRNDESIWLMDANNKETNLSEYITTTVSNIRRTSRTIYNKESSRSQIIICLKFTNKLTKVPHHICICDLSGVENKITCTSNDIKKLYSTYSTEELKKIKTSDGFENNTQKAKVDDICKLFDEYNINISEEILQSTLNPIPDLKSENIDELYYQYIDEVLFTTSSYIDTLSANHKPLSQDKKTMENIKNTLELIYGIDSITHISTDYDFRTYNSIINDYLPTLKSSKNVSVTINEILEKVITYINELLTTYKQNSPPFISILLGYKNVVPPLSDIDNPLKYTKRTSGQNTDAVWDLDVPKISVSKIIKHIKLMLETQITSASYKYVELILQNNMWMKCKFRPSSATHYFESLNTRDLQQIPQKDKEAATELLKQINSKMKEIINTTITDRLSSLIEKDSSIYNKIIIRPIDLLSNGENIKTELTQYMKTLDTKNTYTELINEYDIPLYKTHSGYTQLQNYILDLRFNKSNRYIVIKEFNKDVNELLGTYYKKITEHINKCTIYKNIAILKYNCDVSAEESGFINKTLEDLRTDIAKVSMLNLTSTHLIYDVNIGDYCRNILTHTDMYIDFKSKLINSHSNTKFGQIFNKIKELNIPLNELYIMLFNFSNFEITNNEKPEEHLNPPYINLNDIKYYSQIEPNREKLYTALTEFIDLSQKFTFYQQYGIGKEALSNYLAKHQIIDEKNLNPNTTLKDLQDTSSQIIENIGNNNANTLIGCLETTNALQSTMFTSLTCKYNKEYTLLFAKYNTDSYRLTKALGIDMLADADQIKSMPLDDYIFSNSNEVFIQLQSSE